MANDDDFLKLFPDHHHPDVVPSSTLETQLMAFEDTTAAHRKIEASTIVVADLDDSLPDNNIQLRLRQHHRQQQLRRHISQLQHLV